MCPIDHRSSDSTQPLEAEDYDLARPDLDEPEPEPEPCWFAGALDMSL